MLIVYKRCYLQHYGFVRFADEIVDSFHGFDKVLIDDFEKNIIKLTTR
jgi:hypothetical protein